MKVVKRTFHSRFISFGACPDSLLIYGAAVDKFSTLRSLEKIRITEFNCEQILIIGDTY